MHVRTNGEKLLNAASQRRAMVCLVLAMLFWGSSFIAAKIAFAEWPPLWVIFSRMVLGSAIFLCAWRWRGQFDYRNGDWKYLLGLATCQPCLYFIFESTALQYTSASQAGMITALLPLMVAMGAFAFLRERVSTTQFSGFLIAVAGTIWLTIAGEADQHAPAPLLGNLLEFLAIASAVGGTLMLKRLSDRYSPFLLTALQCFVGMPFFLSLAVIREPVPSNISLTGISAILYLGLVASVGAFMLYSYGIRHLPVSQASAFVNLIPLFSLLIAALFLGERFNSQQLLGAGIIFAGVALSQWRVRPRSAVAVTND